MKIIFTLLVIALLGTGAFAATGKSTTRNGVTSKTDTGKKRQAITIGSSRASGDMLLRFTANKDGAVLIAIINESGKIVLQQTNQVTNSINTIPLQNATELKEGTYTVQLVSNNETYTTHFMIWK